ncbi:MAG: DMT family transporter [Planctomycetes bacterium]|nr:DMT family transporter [Planctomycetota bacterium]
MPFPVTSRSEARPTVSAAADAHGLVAAPSGPARAHLIVALVLWASAFAGIRAGLAGFAPAHLALLRFGVASIVLAIVAAIRGLRLPAPRDVPGLALAALSGIAVYHVALNTGEASITAGAASLILGIVPVVTALLASIFLRERLGTRGWLGLATSFAGAALIALGETGGLRFARGALWVLVAAISQATTFVAQKPYLRKYAALDVTTWVVWMGTAALLVFAPGLVDAVRRAPPAATWTAVYLGVFPAALANVAYATALARGETARVAGTLYVVPAMAIAIAWVWLGERPGALSLLGGAIAIAGVWVVVRRRA